MTKKIINSFEIKYFQSSIFIFNNYRFVINDLKMFFLFNIRI